jgi:hypothetical protein
MRSLSDSDLLHLWEGGMGRHPLDRALLALGAAFPEMPYERLAEWPLGRRNEALVDLRCSCFGRKMAGWVSCASCGEKLEFDLDGGALIEVATKADGRSSYTNSRDGLIVFNQRSYRLPTSRDLTKAAHETDPRRAAICIAENCRLAPSSSTENEANSANVPSFESWADEELDEIGELMALADPLAETRLALHCPRCQSDWQESLDVAAFLWAEIEAHARRLLLEINTLAAAYGWSEAEILSLSEFRRARYVEMVQS